jgi:hypothetical protein
MNPSAPARNSSSTVSIRVDRFHPRSVERASVLDYLLADRAKAGILGRVVDIRCKAVDHAAWSVLLIEFGIVRPVLVLRFLGGVEVVQVAVELVEPVHGWQVLVEVTEVVLAEMAGGVSLGLEQLGQGGIVGTEAQVFPGQANAQETGTERALAGDEGAAPGGAGLLAVGIGEDDAFLGDTVDVRCAVAHDAHVVGTKVPVAEVIAEDDDDVRLVAVATFGGDHRVVIGGWGRAVLGGGGFLNQTRRRGRDGGLDQCPPRGGAVLEHRIPGHGACLGLGHRWVLEYRFAVFERHSLSFLNAGKPHQTLCEPRLGPSASGWKPGRDGRLRACQLPATSIVSRHPLNGNATAWSIWNQ